MRTLALLVHPRGRRPGSDAPPRVGLILLLATALSGQSMTWTPVVAVIAALTMTAGNLLALRQRSAARLLA
ncbi:hypothetical protein [Nonomuraea aurantiaca]|uniref:hypothetical protein n=1 Tax=Nonomuraea aurantiaca TaxID=2878562 RepID=UPI001CD941DB|nr:hypothetical protein [Nonomuraea aurantiaca]MCA2229766.1 hypothetical protein [Nonomuraea aurantiaca]